MTPRKEGAFAADGVLEGTKASTLPTMDSRRPIITIAGTTGVGKKSIVARIIGHADDVSLRFPCPWTIDTKYYTADVQIEVASFTDGECCSAHVSDSEALLLVFDVTHKESLHSFAKLDPGPRWEYSRGLPHACQPHGPPDRRIRSTAQLAWLGTGLVLSQSLRVH